MKLVSLEPSTSPTKKWKAVFENPKHTTQFGAKGYTDYTILNKNKDPEADEHKQRYRQRHEKDLSTHDPTSPGYMSYYILWNKPTIRASLQDYKHRFSL
jgi:hypothetical protein